MCNGQALLILLDPFAQKIVRLLLESEESAHDLFEASLRGEPCEILLKRS